MRPGAEEDVKRIFAESDAGELPRVIGVRERRLYRFGDLYMHFFLTEGDPRQTINEVRDQSLFRDISQRLDPYITAYDPETWRGPEDAMAKEFYTWRADS